MRKIYFVADTHFNHTNIIKYCNRPFDNVEEMNEALIENWNSVVSDNDIIYHLGDLALSNEELLRPITEKLNGKKYLIRGNHDNNRVASYERLGFTVLKEPPVIIDKYKIALSHVPLPDSMFPKDYINIHGHIHDKKLEEIKKRNSDELRYPVEEYTPSKHFCVSIDVTDLKPIELVEILERMK